MLPPRPVLAAFFAVLLCGLASFWVLCGERLCGDEVAPPAPGNADTQTVTELFNRAVKLEGKTQIRVTGRGADPIAGCMFNFVSPDAWLFFDHIRPSQVIGAFMGRFRVNGEAVTLDANIRVAQYGDGAVVIPQGRDFAAMTVFDGPGLAGASMPLRCGVKYDDAGLGAMKMAVRSFRLKRGYMATIAQNENGTGASVNYVAQDHDVEVNTLPAGLDKGVRFVRIFPWRWTAKKGVCGDIWKKLDVGWYYDWNIAHESTADLEYAPIRQNLYWPDLGKQDWWKIGSPHLLGYNEPDHKDQSNLTVDQAIAGWPDLLATGLRLGSPAVSDGGLGWLYAFMEKADAAGLRVDFVAVHYYRSYSHPGDPKGAAAQFYNYLKQIHDRTKRPIWITEFNNGANWTKDPKPTAEQEKATIAAFVEMLDRTPFVERYAIYNWVEDVRRMQNDEKNDGPLTPAGEVYRDEMSPAGYVQSAY